MKSRSYDGRLPALKVDSEIHDFIHTYADRHRIGLAEAHRHLLAEIRLIKIRPTNPLVIPIVGTVDQNDIIHEFAKAA